jgi:hypothetical protein
MFDMENRMRSILLTVILLGVAGVSVGRASIVPPCSAGAAGENIIPVTSGTITYCVSDFGWSDAWFVGTPAGYDPNKDVLSGDDAFNLKYTTATGGRAGLGWLSPSLDKGLLSAQPVVSAYSIVTPVHLTGTNSAESIIANPDGLRIVIDTYALGPGVVIQLGITNTSQTTISNLRLSDYFNFHPNGSISPLNFDGTTSYANGCITTTGVPIALLSGTMCGSSAPSAFDVGLAYGASPVWADVQNNTFNNNPGPVGPDDSAGALAWDLGNIASGATVTFTVGKNDTPGIPRNDAPEPASILLSAGALAAIMAGRYRSRRGSLSR